MGATGGMENNPVNIKNTILAVCAVGGWGLAVVLVAQLLSGTFDGRVCRSGCVLALYWAAFGVTAAGLVFGAAVWREIGGGAAARAAMGALALLMAVFAVTMAVGVFG